MSKSCLWSILLASIFISAGRSQSQLTDTYGDPCSYSLTAALGYTGCASGGVCDPQAINGPATIGVSWFESWSCSNGFVAASGSTTTLYQSIPLQGGCSLSVPYGLQVNGKAVVTAIQPGGWSTTTTYHGWDEEDCDGGTDYSGKYSYKC